MSLAGDQHAVTGLGVGQRPVDSLGPIDDHGTARFQTVESGPYADLLEGVGSLTGEPVVLNTSFNGRGQPIVLDPLSAVETGRRLGLDAAVVGEALVSY